MTIFALGKITGQFPTAGWEGASSGGGLAGIVVAQDPTAQGITYLKQGVNTIRAFGKPSPSGPLEQPERIFSGGGNSLDPRQFSIAADIGGEGLYLTLFVE